MSRLLPLGALLGVVLRTAWSRTLKRDVPRRFLKSVNCFRRRRNIRNSIPNHRRLRGDAIAVHDVLRIGCRSGSAAGGHEQAKHKRPAVCCGTGLNEEGRASTDNAGVGSTSPSKPSHLVRRKPEVNSGTTHACLVPYPPFAVRVHVQTLNHGVPNFSCTRIVPTCC